MPVAPVSRVYFTIRMTRPAAVTVLYQTDSHRRRMAGVRDHNKNVISAKIDAEKIPGKLPCCGPSDTAPTRNCWHCSMRMNLLLTSI
jgi:hypothetical protein